MKYLRCAALVALVVVVCTATRSASADDPHTDTPKPWTDPDPNGNDGRFHFAIVSDRTGGHRRGVFADAIRKVNLLDPDFVVSVGDLVEGDTDDEVEIDRMWDEFEAIVAPLTMPFYYVPGNHGRTNDVMERIWTQRFGRSYYHFTYRNVLFMCLNTEEMDGLGISPEQVAYFRQTLAQHAGVRWTFAFMHRPLWMEPEDPGWLAIEKLLQGRPYTVFAGHLHQYMKSRRFNRRYFVLATTGAVSALTGPAHGLFDHIMWVSMEGDGPRLSNLMLDGIWDENVRTERTAELVDALFDGSALGPEALFCEQPVFEHGTLQIRLTNLSDGPLELLAEFAKHSRLTPKPARFERTVPARSSMPIEVELRADKSASVDDIPPLMMDWSASYQLPGRQPLDVDGTHRFAIDAIFDCPHRIQPVIVDGHLDEWTEFPYACNDAADIAFNSKNWKGPADSSFRFATAYDDEFAYVAIQATDERIVFEPASGPWFQDGLEIRFDARPPQPDAGAEPRNPDTFLLIGICPGETAEDMVISHRPVVAKAGVKAVCLRTDTGFEAEIAIPARYLDDKQGGAWETFRLNIAQDDYDGDVGDSSKASQIWWRPDWRSRQDYRRSGTFRR